MVSPLTSLYVSGSANVQGTGIQSHQLQIIARDNAVVYLRGKLDVLQIQNNSKGNMDLEQIHSPYLNLINQGSGRTKLAGDVDNFSAQLTHSAVVDARGLNAKEIHARTQDQALIHVSPISALYAFAYSQSNIYYYRIPNNLMVFNTHSSGNILRIQSFVPPLIP